MLDSKCVAQLGDFLSLFKPKGKKSGGSKKGGKKAGKVRATTVKKSGGSKKGKTIKANKSGGQRSMRRTQRSVSPSRSKKK